MLGLCPMIVYAKPEPPCEQINPENKDVDGMPFCPESVSSTNAWAVYRCAISQADSFHPPTKAEVSSMTSLLKSYEESVVQGTSSRLTENILSSADQLNLQVCRVKSDNPYLLLYTKPGVKDYSGPFLMLRQGKSSKVIIVSPHDDSDSTFQDTKIALANSHALAVISNGHRRGAVGKRRGDFVHEVDNLGTVTVRKMANLFSGYVWLHIHGMADNKHILLNARSEILRKTFVDFFMENTVLKAPSDYKRLNADFTIDHIVNTDYYLKTEIPVKIHRSRPVLLSQLVVEIEKNPWAWLGNVVGL